MLNKNSYFISLYIFYYFTKIMNFTQLFQPKAEKTPTLNSLNY